ncbi:ABC transporter permease subunit [Streptomyces sp. NBC_01235]|uniref:ABC transporter permease subunit n=1 Tax=Streptomyces sp. NBC_01235 TaxID=2903788 RepID=UPI002E139B9B|nr:ABC transporter permease subunit [Streptomyces sp. NBC_01235]
MRRETVLAGHLHAEWTKLRTLPSSWWLAAAIPLLTLALGAAALASLTAHVCPSLAACHEDTVKLSLTGIWAAQAAALILGVLSMGGEYATGTIRTTLTAMPARGRVLAAKATALAALTATAATAGVLPCLLLARLILPTNGFTKKTDHPLPTLTDPSTLRATFGSVLCLALVALLGLALATLLRGTSAAVTLGLGVLYVVPLLADILASPTWQDRLNRWTPMPAALSIQATRDLDRLPIAPWPGLAVLAAYAATLLAGAALLLGSRDA